jgi:PAS domain S-box-containing protein
MGILELDIRTIIVLLVIGNLAAFATIFAYQTRIGAERATRLYMAGTLLQAAAWSLLGLRGIVPDLLSVYIGNALLLASFGLESLAIGSTEGRDRSLDTAYAALTLAGIAGFCVFAGAPNSRVAAASVATMLPFGFLAASMLRTAARSRLRGFIGWAAASFCLIMLARAASALVRGPNFSLLTPALVQTLAFLPLFLFLLVGTIGFILLLKERGDILLRESEEQYRTLVELASEAIIIAQDEKFAFANRRMGDLLGVPAESLVGCFFSGYVVPEDRELVLSNFRARVAGEVRPESYDLRIHGSGGSVLWLSASLNLVQWRGRPAILALLTDITSRKRSEERVAQLLKEKEVLLREVHHRIKNNLSVAMSLLSLQADQAGTKTPEAVLLDARNRLQSLAQLYELLHRSGSFAEMSVREFFTTLVREIASVFPSSASVRFQLELEDFALDVGRLTSLGIMLNEMVTNSLKHAFGESGGGTVLIAASVSQGRVRVRCEDTGRGLAPGYDECPSPGLGMQLIRMLATQLEASLRIEGDGGTRYFLEFDLVPETREVPRP